MDTRERVRLVLLPVAVFVWIAAFIFGPAGTLYTRGGYVLTYWLFHLALRLHGQ